MRINNRRKKRISIKMFEEEFGEDFSEHVKARLMELNVRTLLTRKDKYNVLDITHVEHIKHEVASGSEVCEKEYVYGELVAFEGNLYFCNECVENDEIVKSDIVDEIYNSLSDNNIVYDEEKKLKVLNDDNIDYVVDTILKVCPEVSEKYINIVKGMISRSETGR